MTSSYPSSVLWYRLAAYLWTAADVIRNEDGRWEERRWRREYALGKLSQCGREYVGVRAFKPEAAAPWQRSALAMLASAAAWRV